MSRDGAKRHKLVVPCHNRVAHRAVVHLIPIAERFKTPTAVRCDLCGKISTYSPNDILVRFAKKEVTIPALRPVPSIWRTRRLVSV